MKEFTIKTAIILFTLVIFLMPVYLTFVVRMEQDERIQALEERVALLEKNIDYRDQQIEEYKEICEDAR